MRAHVDQRRSSSGQNRTPSSVSAYSNLPMVISVKLLVKRLSPSAILPSYAHPGDAGLDLFANVSLSLEPGEVKLVGTGISIELPAGTEAQVRPRSGLALKHGITVLNTPGTIDQGYRGEVG